MPGAIELIQQANGQPSAALEYVAFALGMPAPDKGYKMPANWCVRPLSLEHRNYAAGKIDLPLRVLQFLMPGVGVEEMPAHIKSNYPWYVPYETALARLAEAHVRGVPYCLQSSGELKAHCLSEISQATSELTKHPEYLTLREHLADPHAGETREMQQALVAHAAVHGVNLSPTGAGNRFLHGPPSKSSRLQRRPSAQLKSTNRLRDRTAGFTPRSIS
jgi:hypothetical protein